MNKTVALEAYDPLADLQLCYKVFDILYVKGFQGEECNMMNFRLESRRQVISKIIQPVKDVFEVVEALVTSNIDEISSEFNKAILQN